MNYTVLWLPDAEQELAAVWLASSDRLRVTQAAHAIDQALGNDPLNEGESRPDNRRILFSPPLGVIYSVSPDDRRVEVLHVWEF